MISKLDDFFLYGYTNQRFEESIQLDEYNLQASPLINGKIVDIDQAIQYLRDTIRLEAPLHFDGLSCDLRSLNSIFDLAEFLRSSINHLDGDEINNFFSAYQKYGSSLISFNELKKRADLILMLGDFDKNTSKSFLSKISSTKTNLKNSIYCLNFNTNKVFKNEIKCKDVFSISEHLIDLFEQKIKKEKLKDLRRKFDNSKYAVVVINPKNGFMFCQEIFKTLELINNKYKKLRMFKLSGNNNVSGFVNICGSKTGFPGGINFTDWGAIHDPLVYKSNYLKESKKNLICFSNLNSNVEIKGSKRNIFIGHPNLKRKNLYDLYIPVKTPGFDTEGLVVRSDGISLLKLEKKLVSSYIEIKEIINEVKSTK